jgi:hypothetical protein
LFSFGIFLQSGFVGVIIRITIGIANKRVIMSALDALKGVLYKN